MQEILLNFEAFDLGFFENLDCDDDLSSYDQKEAMLDLIPDSAFFLGHTEADVDNWTSWHLESEYYIIPLINDDFQWAVFRLNWDDNWEEWKWEGLGRVKGSQQDHRKAGYAFLNELWKKQDIDFSDPDYETYRNVLEELEVK